MSHDTDHTATPEKIAGILGGMGPEATVDLMQRIIAHTHALDDADHIRCIVDNNPKIPSRVRAILGEGGENPGPCMAEMARGLQGCGADFIVIPCNTAHEYYRYVAEAVDIPVVHLVGLVVDHVITMNPKIATVGILGSNTISKTQIYTTAFKARGIEALYPDPEAQEALFQIICRVKRGETEEDIRREFREIAAHLAGKGVATAILGCTELGIIAENMPIPVVDAADVLAREVVAVAKNGKMPHIESVSLDKEPSSR